MKKLAVIFAAFAASMMGSDLLTVRLPFAANVGGTPLAAGEYRVSTVETGGSTSVVYFEGKDGRQATALARKVSQVGQGKAELMFSRTASHGLRLSQIFVDGRAFVYDLDN